MFEIRKSETENKECDKKYALHLKLKNLGIMVDEILCIDGKFKGCVHYIFASLFFKSKREQLWNFEKCFLFYFKSSFYSQENQILEF